MGRQRENERMRSIGKTRSEGRRTGAGKEKGTREDKRGEGGRGGDGGKGRRGDVCNDIQIKYPPHCAAYGKPTRPPWKRERNIYIQSVPDSADVPSRHIVDGESFEWKRIFCNTIAQFAFDLKYLLTKLKSWMRLRIARV